MTQRLVVWSYGAALFTVPWAGLGTVKVLTGIDLGAGLQPAYLLLAIAILVSLVGGWRARSLLRQWHDLIGRGSTGQTGVAPGPVAGERFWRRVVQLTVLALLAVLISAAGLVIVPGEGTAADHWLRFAKQIVQLLVMGCFVFFPALWTNSPARWRWTVRLLVAGAAFQIVYSGVQAAGFYTGSGAFARLDAVFTSNPAILSGSEELYLDGAFQGIPRLRGTMCEPLYLGNYLLLVLPLLLTASVPPRWRRPMAIAAVVLLGMTWARGAYVGLAAASAVAALLWARSGLGWRPRQLLLVVVLITLVGGLVALLLGGTESLLLPWRRAVQSLDREDWSNLTRLYSMRAAWTGFLLSPLVGLGWGQFAYHFPLLTDPLGLQSQFAWPVVNNLPLQVLCETGLCGALVMLAVTVALCRRVWRALAPVDPHDAAHRRAQRRIIAAAAATAGIWVQLLTFSQYNLPHIWVAVGLLLASLSTSGRATTVARPRSQPERRSEEGPS